jgi:hypothetical protein
MTREARELMQVAHTLLFEKQRRCNAASIGRFSVPQSVRAKSKHGVEKSLSMIEAGLQAKAISNVAYKASKDMLNHAVAYSAEDVWRPWLDVDQQTRQENDHVWYAQPQALADVPRLDKRLQGYSGPMRKQFDEYIEEWLPIARAVSELKRHVKIGGKINPDKPAAERYAPPRAAGMASSKMVADALEKTVEQFASKLADSIADEYMKAAEQFIRERKPTEGPYEYFARDPVARGVVSGMVEPDSNRLRGEREYHMRLNANAVAAQAAEKRVYEIVRRYQAKNISKIAPVVERKAGLTSVDIKRGSLQGWGFEGEFTCVFGDGTEFTVRNKIVYKMNMQGTDFSQFPTTFHNVKWPSGKRSHMLSEKQMNEEWAVTA